MKVYIVEWVDLVSKQVRVMANSEEDAVNKFNNEEGFNTLEIQETDVEYHQEPHATLDD